MSKLLVIAGHPQDLFERCGGTTLKHIERGDEVMFVRLTNGVATHAFGVFEPEGDDKPDNFDEIVAFNRQEVDEACELLGVTS